jgi:sugar lactone lactonase YvrE
MKRSHRIWAALAAGILLLAVTSGVGAQGLFQPYDSYTIDSTGRPVPLPDPYELDHIIHGVSLGIGDLKTPGDILIDRSNDHLYIVDTGNHRIVELDDQGQVVRQFGAELDLKAPQGLYRDRRDGTLWIADTGNGRVLQVSSDGNLLQEFGPPQSNVLAEIQSAAPDKVLVDKRGYVYYLEGSGAGMIVMDQQNQFRGFFGTTRAGFSLWWLFVRFLYTDEQAQQVFLAKPTAHTDMFLADDGFIYSAVSGATSRQIQKLSPVGVNIFVNKSLEQKLYKNKIFGERRRSWEQPARFVSVTVHDNGTIIAVDQGSGRIYQYDQDRNLLLVFGRRGVGRGEYQLPSEVDVDSRGRLYILDVARAAVYVLRPTRFAQLLHHASALQFDGRYDEAAAAWQQVLGLTSNYELAHSGIGAAHYHAGRWQDAMREYSVGRDQLGYSLAFYEYRQQQLRGYIGWLVAAFFAAMIVIVAWPVLSRFRPPRGRAAGAQRRVHLRTHLLGILLRPIETFERLAQGRSLWPVVILLALAAAVRLVSLALIAFHMRATPTVGSLLDWFRLYRPVAVYLLPELRWEDANFFVEILRIALPWTLWTIANYGVSALFEGSGTFRGVARTTAYCLVPYILFAVPIALLSHLMTAQERGLYEILWSLVYLWVLLLLLLEIRTVHDYLAGRTVGVGLVMVFGLLVLSGSILAVGLLSNEVINFAGEVLYEIVRIASF